MKRLVGWRPMIALTLGLICLGAAPSATSYFGVEQTITKIQDAWSQEGARPQPHAAGWNAFFDSLRGAFQAYSKAQTSSEQLRVLDRLYRFSVALRGITWKPAVEVREELRAWLRPRVRLAWAQRRLVDAVRGMPPTTAADVRANRARWIQFTSDDLGTALRSYEAAATVAQHQEALKRIQTALDSLESGNTAHPWAPALAIQEALNDLFDAPNINVTADLATVRPAFETNVVEEGPVFFRGQWSYVTPGPKTGFGLVPSENGIEFTNSQLFTSVTPIRGFNEEMEQDPRGQRVTKLYHFDATSRDRAELTISTVIRGDGLHIWPSYRHNVDASICSSPVPGNGLGRLIAGLLTFNQNKITRKVYEGAIGKIREGVVSGAMELGTIRTSEAAEVRNAQMRKFLPGRDVLSYREIALERLRMGSRTDSVHMTGKLLWQGDFPHMGADRRRPAALQVAGTGISSDIHLPSVLTNVSTGYFHSDYAQSLENIMIETRNVEPGSRPRDAVRLTENVEFSVYVQAVAKAKEANDPKVMAIRIVKPARAPEFAVDARGLMVVMVHDLIVDVPAPAQAALGGGVAGPPANIYRLSAPEAELVVSIRFLEPDDETPRNAVVRLEAFDPGPGAKVLAITDDENQAKPLTTFSSALVYRMAAIKLVGQHSVLPLENLPLQGMDLVSIAPIDPSGWTRVVLKRNAEKLGVRRVVPFDAANPPATDN
jgi:hypothetical protein